MLYKFKSKATGDLIMLEPNGRQVLEIVGKTPQPKGIILPADMPTAIAALEAAVVLDESKRRAAMEQARADGGPAPTLEPVSLRQRAAPMIDMLRRCAKAEAEIVWGV